MSAHSELDIAIKEAAELREQLAVYKEAYDRLEEERRDLNDEVILLRYNSSLARIRAEHALVALNATPYRRRRETRRPPG